MNGGEIVEVDGGHIIRSRGRKDRHSKVCTAKGPRDRRVRLSAHTAIEFYDVQDRLGFDRPSKALDWLINKAKPAIDQLAQLPPWKPTLVSKQQRNDDVAEIENANENEFRFLQSFNNNNSSNSFVPFETETTSSSPIQFQNYNNSTPDLLSRSNSNDLRLSLQQNQNLLFSGNFDGIPVTWNSGCGGGGDGGATIDTGSGGGGGSHNDDASGGGFVFRTPSPSPVVFPAVMYGQNQYLSQRGPLQSSYSPSVRAWIDAPTFVAADYRRQTVATGALGAGFASGSFSGFRVPARIGGDEEEVHGGVSVSDRPSSASSDSRR